MKEKELIRLIKASQLYYEQNMTQAEIAKEMEISRPSVSNLLARARKEGLVTITVKPFESTTFGKAQVL
ncbi:MAG: MarR family transcriptional regulator, partial [Eubacterium sp.]